MNKNSNILENINLFSIDQQLLSSFSFEECGYSMFFTSNLQPYFSEYEFSEFQSQVAEIISEEYVKPLEKLHDTKNCFIVSGVLLILIFNLVGIIICLILYSVYKGRSKRVIENTRTLLRLYFSKFKNLHICFSTENIYQPSTGYQQTPDSNMTKEVEQKTLNISFSPNPEPTYNPHLANTPIVSYEDVEEGNEALFRGNESNMLQPFLDKDGNSLNSLTPPLSRRPLVSKASP